MVFDDGSTPCPRLETAGVFFCRRIGETDDVNSPSVMIRALSATAFYGDALDDSERVRDHDADTRRALVREAVLQGVRSAKWRGGRLQMASMGPG